MGVRLLSPLRFFFQVKQRFLAHNVNQCEIRLNKFNKTKEKLNFWSPKRIKVTEFCLKLTAGSQVHKVELGGKAVYGCKG